MKTELWSSARIACVLAILIMLLSGNAMSQSSVLVMTDKAVDQGLLDRTTNFVAHNFWIPVRVEKNPPNLARLTIREQVLVVQKFLGSNDVAAIALVEEQSPEVKQTILIATNVALALVNLSSITERVSVLGKPKAEDTFPRLLQKEVMRAIGSILGLSACPNPQCCMSDIDIPAWIKVGGLNFCPPCQAELEKKIPPPVVSRRKSAGSNAR